MTALVASLDVTALGRSAAGRQIEEGPFVIARDKS
jgi:hypothetical protein